MQGVLARFPFLRSLRLLQWFVLGWVLFVTIFDIIPFQPAFIILGLAHLLLYLYIVTRHVSKHWYWLILCVQAGLIFVITAIERDVVTLFALSLSWGIGALISFNYTRTRLIAIGTYLLLLSLYTSLLFLVARSLFTSVYPIRYLFILTIFLATLSLILYLQQRRAHQQTQVLLNNLHTAHTQLSAYAQRVETLTTLAERQRLARELHDTLSQGIVSLLMQLDAANAHFEKNQYPLGRTIIDQATERARTMLTETRFVISDLRATNPLHPDDLPELAQEEIEHFTNATGIPCQADIDALACTSARHCQQVLRVLAEGLTNIARHANAYHVWVHATSNAGNLVLEVRDDGTGFDPAAMITVPGHYGLIGLRERARVIGGQLTINSAVGEGTTIRMHVPCEVTNTQTSDTVNEEYAPATNDQGGSR